MKTIRKKTSNDIALARRRKLRCGGFSIALTALVVLIGFLVCHIGDTAEERYALAVDCSYNASTTRSATTDAVLKSLKSGVHMYALASQGNEDDTLLALLTRYAAASEQITISEENVLKNPALMTAFTDALGENAVSTDCLIIYSEKNDRARVLTQNDYYTYSYDYETGTYSPSALNYEKAITEAILYVSSDKLPTVQILAGHGEYTDTAAMETALISANYSVERVDLSESALNSDAVLMILSPQTDLSDDELDKLMTFAESGGSFFIISQYYDPTTLENFNALFDYFGISPLPGLVIAKESATDSYYNDAQVDLMPFMQSHPSTDGMIASRTDLLLTPLARAFDTSVTKENVSISPLLITGDAYIRNFADGSSSSEQQPGDLEGVFTVAMLCENTSGDAPSRAFVVGSAATFTDYWVQSYTSSDEFMLNILYYMQEESPVDLDILPKSAARAPLSLGSLTGGVVVIILIPLLVLLIAAFVLMPRKNL